MLIFCIIDEVRDLPQPAEYFSASGLAAVMVRSIQQQT